MIIKRSYFSDKEEKKKKKLDLDPDGELGVSLIMNAGASGGALSGLAASQLYGKYKEKKIRKKAVRDYVKAVRDEDKNYQEGLKKLKEIAAKNNDPNMQSKEMKDALAGLKNMKAQRNVTNRIDAMLSRDEAIRNNKNINTRLKRGLKGGLGGVIVGSAIAAPFAYKYFKNKNKNKKKEKGISTRNAVALGAMGGTVLGHFTSEDPWKELKEKGIKNLDKEALDNIDKKASKIFKKKIALTAGGALVGYGAKKLYDQHNKKKETGKRK